MILDEDPSDSTPGICPLPPLGDYLAATRMADGEAAKRLGGDYMLLSWYDRDRDFESPLHASECHQASAVPGYVDYGLHHGATVSRTKSSQGSRKKTRR